MIWCLALAVLLLAYSNGANDNFKGVATLHGSGVLGYRSALALATMATVAGSLAALFLASELAETFRGRGLVPDALTTDPRFLGAVGLGAASTVLLATRLGLPISTTHALVGALLGAGLVEAGSAVSFTQLGGAFVLPLLAGPFLAGALAATQYPTFRSLRRAFGVEADSCACFGEERTVLGGGVGVLHATRAHTVSVGTTQQCAARYHGSVVGIPAAALLDMLHVVSAAAVSFARGVNDTPKIVALLLASAWLAPQQSLVTVALAMAVGGVLGARRVAETMSHRITGMNAGQAFTGNLSTALLVLLASRLGLPVSTTHVSCGALFGIGLVTGQGRWGTIRRIAGAWVVTLPVAAGLGAACSLLL